MNAGADQHVPVLLEEVLQLLPQRRDGIYVDGTFGRGGHSEALLGQLDVNARLIALDRDPQAVAAGKSLAEREPRLSIHHARFSQLANVLAHLGVAQVDGVLLDLGVSSPQLDDPSRGFSFREDGPLDMRMDHETGESAAQWLNGAEEAEIADVIFALGEERFARRIARAIVTSRPLTTTQELADLIAQAVPGKRNKHPATQSFQAIRMFVNDEQGELDTGLAAGFAALNEGARLAVISFHSLEDRAVKRQFKAWSSVPQLPRRLPTRVESHPPQARVVARRRASDAEVSRNPRSRSATLRVLEKVAQA